MTLLVSLAVAVIFGAGVHLLLRGDVIKIAAGALLVSNAAILFLMASGVRAQRAPIAAHPGEGPVSDPLVQAFALTAIVIGFGCAVLLLRVAVAIERSHDTVEVRDLASAEVEEEPAEERAREERG